MAKISAEHFDHLKFIGEGCMTMVELAQRLRDVAEQYAELVAKGAKLAQPVDNGYIYYSIPGHDVEDPEDDDGIPQCPQCYEQVFSDD